MCSPARFRPLRRALVVVAVLLSGLGATTAPVEAASAPEITLPIHPDFVDQVHWSDTWGAARSGGRSHVGVDMLGPKMTPLVAAADGVISWMRHNSGRGNILYLTADDGWKYYYIHINNDTPGTDDGANPYEHAFGPGIAEGVRVSAGQVIAYMGDSGNAEWTAPHLHFEVVGPDGRNVNPAPIVDAALAQLERRVPAVDPALVAPFADVADFGDALFGVVYGRAASQGELEQVAADVTGSGMLTAVERVIEPRTPGPSLDRLYEAYFLRSADTDGFNYWMSQLAAGESLEDVAEFFALSDEFRIRYGSKPFSEFLDQLYVDVLGRQPDQQGKQYWVGELESGRVSRGTIVVYFTEGDELIALTERRTEGTMVSLLFADRTPSPDEMAQWEQLRASSDLGNAVASLYLGG